MEDSVGEQTSPGVEKVLARLHESTIGQKALMALTGLALVGFVFAHMAGHLIMFQGAEAYNAYAHNLQSLGALKWAARAGLLAVALIHVFTAIQLTRRQRMARPVQYEVNKWVKATLGARTMRVTGAIVFFFILWHLMHFTILSAATNGFVAPPFDLHGVPVPDVYGRMLFAFQRPFITVVYVLCVGLLSLHLSHGIESSLQSLGVLNSTYRPMIKKLAPLLAGLLFAGFAVVPLAILAGVIK